MTLVIQKTAGSNLVLANRQKIPAVIGEAWGGGYFAGYISHTADSVPTHALIVAPKATGASGTGYTISTNLQQKTTLSGTTGATSDFDGKANTDAMDTSVHPAASFCVGLSIDGYSDWYLPARYEAEIAYFNLRPQSIANSSGYGGNPYSVPRSDSQYSATIPGQTNVNLFKSGGSEAFDINYHWTSTQNSGLSSQAWMLYYQSGILTVQNKTTANRVRAFRRIAL